MSAGDWLTPRTAPVPGDDRLDVGLLPCELSLDHESSAGNTGWIKASSTVLARASPFFRAMFHSRTGLETHEAAELRRHRSINIQLPDTNASGLRLLVHVLHHQVPTVLMHHLGRSSADDDAQTLMNSLFEMSILIDRYDCALAVRGWTGFWSKLMESKGAAGFIKHAYWKRRDDGCTDISEVVAKWILISGQLGFAGLFTETTHFGASSLHLHDFEVSCTSEIIYFYSPDLQEALFKQRSQFVRDCQQIVSKVLERLQNKDACCNEAEPRLDVDLPGAVRLLDDDLVDLNCSANMYQNAELVLESFTGDHVDWRVSRFWDNSVNVIGDQMRIFARCLDGRGSFNQRPRQFALKDTHLACSRTGNVMEKLLEATGSACAGLRLQQFGNSLYRSNPGLIRH